MFVHDRVAGSCVAFNSKHRVERIRNTLAHEYAHFLTARTAGAVDFGGQYVRQPALERFANAFAIAFLLPRQGLIRHSAQLRSSAEGRLKVEDVVVLASYYGVSLESMFLRLEDLKLIRRGSWLRLKGEGFSPSDAKQELGIGDSVAAVPLLPRRYVVLAVEAYRSGELSEGQLARFLRSDIVGARDAVRSVGSQDDSVLEGALDSDMQSHRSGENLL
jgi:Zn-dependent peptidase ImmA (M78 family)